MIPTPLVAASTKPLILAILSRLEKSYGYEIIQLVKQLSGGQLEWSDGMLYPVLHRLERERLIESWWGRAENGRRRKYYRLRREGARVLEEERAQWMQVHQTLMTVLNPEWNPHTPST
jgi:PadR family transcriptional regulator PadR